MVCQWRVLLKRPNKVVTEARSSAAVNLDTCPRIAKLSWTTKSPSVVDLMTMTALEVAVERQLGTFHKLRRMSSGRGQWMMICCVFDSQECT